MSLLEKMTSKIKTARIPLRSKRGWIGIDIGARSIKMAQVEASASGYRILARWTLDAENNSIMTRDEMGSHLLKSSLSRCRSLRSLFFGRDCAAVLSMSMVDFRLLEIPRGNADEQNQMIGEELAADLGMEPENLAFDGWEVGNESTANTELTRMATIAVSRTLAEQLNDSLLAAGLNCRALDGMPCALARAVEMAGLGKPERAVIAIDLGYTSPLFVLVKGGRPIFARTLRGVGLQSIVQPLEKSLQISSDECQQLLTRFGVVVNGQAPVVATQKTMQLIADPLHNLVTEIKRTVDYIGTQFRSLSTSQICLFGGGALVKNLPEYLSQQLHLPVAPWTLGGERSDPSDALYGVAAGLSCLQGEAVSCS